MQTARNSDEVPEGLREVYHRNALVNHLWKQGCSLEQMVVALAGVQEEMQDRIVHLLSLAPVKIKGVGGSVFYSKPLPVELMIVSDEYPLVPREAAKTGI